MESHETPLAQQGDACDPGAIPGDAIVLLASSQELGSHGDRDTSWDRLGIACRSI